MMLAHIVCCFFWYNVVNDIEFHNIKIPFCNMVFMFTGAPVKEKQIVRVNYLFYVFVFKKL